MVTTTVSFSRRARWAVQSADTRAGWRDVAEHHARRQAVGRSVRITSQPTARLRSLVDATFLSASTGADRFALSFALCARRSYGRAPCTLSGGGLVRHTAIRHAGGQTAAPGPYPNNQRSCGLNFLSTRVRRGASALL